MLLPQNQPTTTKPLMLTRKLLDVIDMFITSSIMIVSWVSAYVQTHQIVYINYEKFFVYHLYLSKAIKQKKTSHYQWLKLNYIQLLYGCINLKKVKFIVPTSGNCIFLVYFLLIFFLPSSFAYFWLFSLQPSPIVHVLSLFLFQKKNRNN